MEEKSKQKYYIYGREFTDFIWDNQYLYVRLGMSLTDFASVYDIRLSAMLCRPVVSQILLVQWLKKNKKQDISSLLPYLSSLFSERELSIWKRLLLIDVPLEDLQKCIDTKEFATDDITDSWWESVR